MVCWLCMQESPSSLCPVWLPLFTVLHLAAALFLPPHSHWVGEGVCVCVSVSWALDYPSFCSEPLALSYWHSYPVHRNCAYVLTACLYLCFSLVPYTVHDELLYCVNQPDVDLIHCWYTVYSVSHFVALDLLRLFTSPSKPTGVCKTDISVRVRGYCQGSGFIPSALRQQSNGS